MYGYRNLNCIHKNRQHLSRHCRRYLNKVWHFKLSVEQNTTQKKNEGFIRLMKDELGGNIMKEFTELRAKTYSYLIDGGSEDKKGKVQKNCLKKKNYI